MNLFFDPRHAEFYNSPSQKIRILSEHWVSKQVYCPSCGRDNVASYPNNRPVADFFCPQCGEDYELKCGKNLKYGKLVDGSYGAMIARLNSDSNPSLFVALYDPEALSIIDFLVVPKHFFTSQIIEERRPLSASARRAGWTGCNILLDGVPEAGRIFLVRNRIVEPKREVLAKWQTTLFLRGQRDERAKGWLLSVMRCIEKLEQRIFSLQQIYAFEPDLKKTYPNNRFIREKIRQQLQVLRDAGYLNFVGRGSYSLVGDAGSSSGQE